MLTCCKAFASEQPTVILARSQDQAEEIDERWWSFSDDAFIPHQIAGDDDDAICAVLVATPDVSAEDRALVLNLRDECAPGNWDRVLEVVAADTSEREGSRRRWREYQQRGIALQKYDM